MSRRNREQILPIIIDCARLYKEHLAGQKLLFVTVTDSVFNCFESQFLPRNFLHLTGVKSKLSGEMFFLAATQNRLGVKDFELASDGTADLKLDILPQLMKIHNSARMVGDYDNHRPLLITDKFAGTVTMAMGFLDVNGTYVPNTALKKDVREITLSGTRRKVAAIFRKPKDAHRYCELTYITKGLTIDERGLQVAIADKIDFDALTASFVIPREKISE